MSKTFATIVQGFKDFIRGKNSKVELSEGTFTMDVVISAPSKEFEKLYSRVDQVSNEQAITTASDIGLETTALNFSKVRRGARRARTSVKFFRTQSPVTDITIPAGTIVSTLLSNTATAVQFKTTQTITMYAGLALSYFNTSTGKYEITVGVEAVNGGAAGNVGPNTIVSVTGAVAGIEGVYNTDSASGGLDQESATALQTRLAEALSSISVGSLAGFKSFMLEQDGVEDVLVVGQGNTGRAEIGAVDIYVKGITYRSFEDEFSDPFGPYPDFVFTKQPIVSSTVSSVISSGGGILPSSAWSASKDTSVYGGSTLGLDKLHWAGIVPVTSGSIIVNYQYNGLVEDLQSLLSRDNQNVLNSQTLVKWATQIPIDVTMSVRILQGFTGSDVVSLVTSAVQAFLAGSLIGTDVNQSDVIREILNTPGVDDVLVPLTKFQSSDATIMQNALQNLTIPDSAYASAGTITVNLF